MKKFLMVMGTIFCGLIVLIIVAATFAAIRGTRLDKESRTYADAAIPAIVSTWSADAFFDRASTELTRQVSANDADRLFRTFGQLGHLKHCDPAKGQSTISTIIGQPRKITAHYEVSASFEKGDAVIKMDLIKHDNNWQILGFHVDSPAFVPK
jgi:hypothetical protein